MNWFPRRYKTQRHPFHIVSPSHWPVATSLALMTFPIGFVLYFQKVFGGLVIFLLSFVLISYCLGYWFWDIIKEGSFERQHTKAVQNGLKLGFILFLVSETMFFFSFFWAFFHSSLSPAIQIGAVWPPQGIQPINPWGIPLLNTCLLLYSGVTVTTAHLVSAWLSKSVAIWDPWGWHMWDSIIWAVWNRTSENRKYVLNTTRPYFRDFLEITIWYGLIFTFFQVQEYLTASFSITDGIYGSLFYVMTGFHGLHVIVGTIMLVVALIRDYYDQFDNRIYLGFDFAAWYWHFVDVVWIFLFVCLYWWGS